MEDYNNMDIEELLKNGNSIISENDWKKHLVTDSKGKAENCISNYVNYFEYSPKYKGKLAYNEFKETKEFDGRLWSDFDESNAAVYIEQDIGLHAKEKIKDALNNVFDSHRYHPIKEYLSTLKWDGKERIETIFQKCFDIEDNNLVRTMAKKWFIAAVKRIYEPGCKFDNMIVIIGNQGIGKTSFCNKLAKSFSTDVSFSELDNKDIINKLNATWIGIIDEMDNYGKKAMASIKTFLSKTKDTVRLAYGHYAGEYKRHSVFIGSLNEDTFLRDSTSSTERRFWIFKAKKDKWDGTINKLLTDEVVDQLWAEAMTYYNKDKNFYLDIDAELMDAFAEDQLQYKTYNDDVFVDYINNILNKQYCLKDGCFISDRDFYDQFSDNNILLKQYDYINKIPMSSLVFVLKNFYKDTRSGKYIVNALSNDWEYKNIRYNGKVCKGLVRKETKKSENNLFDENTLLPF